MSTKISHFLRFDTFLSHKLRKYYSMNFKDNLKSIRNSQGLNQKKLADILCVSFKTISHWESGYSEPSLEMLIKLKNALKVDFEDLLN